MSKISNLVESYHKYIAIPWRDDAASSQRVIFCVYNQNEELRLRVKIDEFEIATRDSGHDWCLFDLTDTFAAWLSLQRYLKSYFRKPDLISTLLPRYIVYICIQFEEFVSMQKPGTNHVVALKGAGSLFGLIKVKDVIDKIAPLVPGRLLVFFPGSYDENNNYRLFDAYDGWNYLAVPITADRDF